MSDGSRYQGPVPSPRAFWSGVSSMADWVTLVAIAATFAPSPGSSVVDGALGVPSSGSVAGTAAGDAPSRPRAAVRDARSPAPLVSGLLESHCSDAGARKRATPPPSVTVMAPVVSAVTDRPFAVSGKLRDLSAGLSAASWVRTMSTSRHPPVGTAVNCRSTPGSTLS